MGSVESKTAQIGVMVAGGVAIVLWVAAVVPLFLPSGGPTGNQMAINASDMGCSLEVTMTEWGFFGVEDGGPQLNLAGCDELELTLVNEGANSHNLEFVRDGGEFLAGMQFSEGEIVPPGETQTITIDVSELPEGEFYYICSFPGHRAQGMEAIATLLNSQGG